jgi:hypothetical protein
MAALGAGWDASKKKVGVIYKGISSYFAKSSHSAECVEEKLFMPALLLRHLPRHALYACVPVA